MTKFTIKEKKKMPRREDGLASTYNKQTTQEYNRTNRHIQDTWMELLEYAARTRQAALLEQPLKGFPRTKGQANYSILDIYLSLNNQYERSEDYLDSHIDRWNRFFSDWPELQVEFELPQPTTNFGAIFA